MKHRFADMPFVALLLYVAACSRGACPQAPASQQVEVSFDARLTACADVKTSYDSGNHIGLWKREDLAGVFASFGDGGFTDASIQTFRIADRSRSGGEFLPSATFSGKLTDRKSGTYTYYAVYPYSAFQAASSATALTSRLEDRQYPDLTSWDGTCDILVAKPLVRNASSVASGNLQLQFSRLFGVLRLRFASSITDKYGSETVETISIESADANDALAGRFTMDLSSEDIPEAIMSTVAGETVNKVVLDYRGKNAGLSSVEAYAVIGIGTYPDVIITVRTSAHTLVMRRSGLIVERGKLTSASVNLRESDNVSASTPLLPQNPSAFKVLTFGHSYVVDSMEYIDDLLNAAGIKNVMFANLFISNCSLETYWSHVLDAGNTKGGTDQIKYFKRFFDGSAVTTQTTAKTVIDALCDEDWDVVVLQTNIEQLGFYPDFAPYLQKMIDYVETTGREEHSKIPLMGWHMFWPFASHHSFLARYYGNNQDRNYAAHVEAAKEVVRRSGVRLVIPTATAIQSLRRSSLNNPFVTGSGAYEFSRDGGHMDYMAGRYAAACTWFEFFMKPCLGRSVLGNPFIPSASSSWEGVKVTAENRLQLQRSAALACESPFEIAHLDAVSFDYDAPAEEYIPDGCYDWNGYEDKLVW